jgi:hypothetical protein
MTRVVIFFVAVATLAAFAMSVANHFGIITIEWPAIVIDWPQLYRGQIEVDIGLFVVALLVLAAPIFVAWSIFWSIARRIYR